MLTEILTNLCHNLLFFFTKDHVGQQYNFEKNYKNVTRKITMKVTPFSSTVFVINMIVCFYGKWPIRSIMIHFEKKNEFNRKIFIGSSQRNDVNYHRLVLQLQFTFTVLRSQALVTTEPTSRRLEVLHSSVTLLLLMGQFVPMPSSARHLCLSFIAVQILVTSVASITKSKWRNKSAVSYEDDEIRA